MTKCVNPGCIHNTHTQAGYITDKNYPEWTCKLAQPRRTEDEKTWQCEDEVRFGEVACE